MKSPVIFSLEGENRRKFVDQRSQTINSVKCEYIHTAEQSNLLKALQFKRSPNDDKKDVIVLLT